MRLSGVLPPAYGSVAPAGESVNHDIQEFLSGPRMSLVGGRVAIATRSPFGQHNVHLGDRRLLLSKDAHRDQQQGHKVPVAIKESSLLPKMVVWEPASTISPAGPRASSLEEENHCPRIRFRERGPK